MLSRANRLLTADDFRTTLRRGRRFAGEFTVTLVHARSTDDSPRFGFIVSSKVGNAVTRNLVRRRLRSIARESLSDISPGTDVVVRALPTAAGATWASLQGEVTRALSRSTRS